MKEYQKIVQKLKQNKKEFNHLQMEFKKLLNNKKISFDEKLSIWEKAEDDLKIFHLKIPKTENPMIKRVFSEIYNQLETYKKTDLSIGLMDDIAVYKDDAYVETFDSCSHLKTKKDFVKFMEFVFKHNIGYFRI